MTRRTVFSRIAVAVVGLAGVLTLAAFRGGPPGHGGRGGPGAGMGPGPEGFFGARVEDMLDDVDATPQQRDQVHAIAAKLREKGMAMRQAHHQDRQQLVASFKAGQLDKKQLTSVMDRHADQMKAFNHELADAIVQVQNILTPEQRAKIAAKWERRMQRWGGPQPSAPPAPPAPPPPPAK